MLLSLLRNHPVRNYYKNKAAASIIESSTKGEEPRSTYPSGQQKNIHLQKVTLLIMVTSNRRSETRAARHKSLGDQGLSRTRVSSTIWFHLVRKRIQEVYISLPGCRIKRQSHNRVIASSDACHNF